MQASQIRKTFLDYFASKNHLVVPSAPLVVKNDPTLLFTNAGMNQFKDYFLGNKEPHSKRIANTQKCLRVSGKHNDLEEVGIDTYHHTMFEMLGNWSFGDYFKKEAIEWAWELLTEVYKLPKDRLYVTVFGGDAKDGLEEDAEAVELWKSWTSSDRILKCSKKDNFWEMGDTGPCGPCTEIHIDLRPDSERASVSGYDLVNNDHPQVIEIWNLVFIQFNRKADSSLEELPDKHVDTGMGFERLCRAIQAKSSNYDTDVFGPVIQQVSALAGIPYGSDEKTDIATRVISDHIRAISFAISDGQLPSNGGAGYVIRRILRRAVRYGYTFLGFKEPFLYSLVPTLANEFAHVFPELKAQESFVSKVIEEEEASFLRTLSTGIKRLESIQQHLKGSVIDGDTVFELYDTYGFPVDLTALIARENGLSIDEDGFKKAMEVQKTRSRSATATEAGDWIEVTPIDRVDFVGYDVLQSTAKIAKYRQVKGSKGNVYQLVLDRTPFYPEGGGQQGDTGVIKSNTESIFIEDTKKENDLIIHITSSLPKDLSAQFECQVDEKRRLLAANNHSATHLLQAALRTVLGDHVAQKGSLVTDELLRFDFAHFTKVTDEEIAKIEHIVNEKIRLNITLDERRNVPIQDALKLGATALFGEKYGDFVRVITFDPSYSVELCGGIHVPSTSQIGLFKIVSEGSVAAGVRRIEAVTGAAADAYYVEKISTLEAINELLKQPKDLVKAVEQLLSERSSLLKKIESFRLERLGEIRSSLLDKVTQHGGAQVIIERVDVDSAETVKQLSYELKDKLENMVLVLASNIEGKPFISVMLSENLVADKNLHAGNLVKELAKSIEGGGGGQAFYATAGGKNISGLDEVISKAKVSLLN